jgi:anthranilate/para-aminobenzoate synthase component II
MIIVVDNTRGSQNTYYNLLIMYLKSRKLAHRTVRDVAKMKDVLRNSKVDQIILSGSTAHIPEMDETHAILNEMALKSGKPVLGICFGAQFICTYFGGTIERMSKMVCDWRCLNGTHENVKARFCARYRIDTIPTCMMSLSTSKLCGTNTIVHFRHMSSPITGLLFHPEYDKYTHHILDELLGITTRRKE